MDCLARFHKHPSDQLLLRIDWRPWLNGQSIISSNWENIGLGLSSPGYGSGLTWVTVSGGVNGGLYEVKNRITTSAGNIDVRRVRIVVLSLASYDPEQVGWRGEALD